VEEAKNIKIHLTRSAGAQPIATKRINEKRAPLSAGVGRFCTQFTSNYTDNFRFTLVGGSPGEGTHTSKAHLTETSCKNCFRATSEVLPDGKLLK
jgi:hypothetical protein